MYFQQMVRPRSPIIRPVVSGGLSKESPDEKIPNEKMSFKAMTSTGLGKRSYRQTEMAEEEPLKVPKRMTRELSFAQDQAPSEEDEGYALKHTVTPKFTVVKTKINKDINLLVTRNKLQQDYEGKAEEGRRMRKNDD